MGSREQDVGITQFANQLPGFKGILKHRYTDFKVNEVDPKGAVIRLTSLATPQPAQAAASGTDVGAASGPADLDAALASFTALAGEAQVPQLRDFLEQALAWQAEQDGRGKGGCKGDRPQPPAPLTLDPIAQKDTRKAVHQLFKALPGFPPLETTTVAQQPAAAQGGESSGAVGTGRDGGAAGQSAEQPEQEQAAAGEAGASAGPPAAAASTQQRQHQPQAAGGQQCIQLQVAGSGGGGRGGRGQKRKWGQASGWAGGDKGYVRFVLYKENMDSQVAISTLARLLRVNHKIFGVAGTKDKRGVTVQAVTVHRVDPARLAALNPRLRSMRVGNFSFCDGGLWLGDLSGNRFEILLRNVEAESPAVVEAAAEGLRQSGFVNYFGLQRFGSGVAPTHRIGQALLQGRWQQAINLIFAMREDARPELVAAAKAYLEEGDIAKAQRLMPRHQVAECAILQGLQQYSPTQLLQALQLIPRNLRTMYLHAYQSYLWNAAASHRVSAFPHDRPVAGDLVLPPPPTAGAASEAVVAAGEAAAAEGDVAAAVEEGLAAAEGDDDPAAAAAALDISDEGGGSRPCDSKKRRSVGSVHVVTEAEAEAGTFSMDDVVLPLPGNSVQYPRHATAQVYIDMAARDGVSLTQAPHGTREFMLTELPGSYRRVIHRPADLQWELVWYGDPDQELAATDLMELEGRSLPPPAAGAEQGKYLALRLAFQLPTSCYATMLIRELTKMPTHTAFHKAASAAGAAASAAAVAAAASPDAAEGVAAAAAGAEPDAGAD